ncbi:helix-turn-helix transcriptional regulator [Paenibacillus hamazuiensis]|uniref:helix-turn-helix transcriptional regulator n=1 Tax=Paenibacillus hamazuiensis TaxID=2936508 RepID=UPI00200F68AF|nr:helix-turn-helix transcriptional regulator [Paenibacillus hamazuiensis]
MSSQEQRLKALGNYLKSCRARLTPGSVGLPPGYTRRKTPGLRREEVAQLAGVSTTWYTWLEQGRDIHVSKQVLDCIGRALRLNADEYAHMMNLAQFQADPPAANGKLLIPQGLQKIIEDLAYPAMAVNRRTDVLAWNKAACSYFADFPTIPDQERNMIWQWFTNSAFRLRLANWEERSPYAAALFRGLCDMNAGDPQFSRLVDDLLQTSPSFKEHWTRHEVKQKSGGVLEFVGLGGKKQSFEVTSFMNINGMEDIHFFVLTPCVTSG